MLLANNVIERARPITQVTQQRSDDLFSDIGFAHRVEVINWKLHSHPVQFFVEYALSHHHHFNVGFLVVQSISETCVSGLND